MSGVGLPAFGDYGLDIATSGAGVTPGSGARGAYAELFSATVRDYDGFAVRVYTGDGTYYGVIDFALGAASSEVVHLSLPFSQNSGSRSYCFWLPWHVPAGSRVSARVQSSDSTNGPTVYLDAYPRSLMTAAAPRSLINYGLGSVSGVAFTSGAAAGIQQITAATTRPHQGLVVCLQTTSYFGDEVSSFYLYTGAGGAELLAFEVAPIALRGEDYVQHYFNVPVRIPQGTRLSFQWAFGGGGLFNGGAISALGY